MTKPHEPSVRGAARESSHDRAGALSGTETDRKAQLMKKLLQDRRAAKRVMAQMPYAWRPAPPR